MKKFLTVLLALSLMAACSAPKEVEAPENEIVSYSVLAPKGAPALGVVRAMTNDRGDQYTLVDGADVLTTELAKEESEYDIIVAPINVGAKLISAGKSPYKLAAVLTWGNLYVIGTEDANDTHAIAAFGEAAVPGKVFGEVWKKLEMSNDVVYYPSVTEAQASLLSGKAKLALIAEPAVTATIAKAKANGMELSVKMDVQAKWEEIYGSYGYPQAAVFVKNSAYENNEYSVNAYLDSLNNSINTDLDAFMAAIEKVGAEELGVPNAQVATKSYDRQNIKYVVASEVKKEIQDFLTVFGITVGDEIYLK